MTETMPPVTVVGANPRGAAIAGALARAGHAVTLVDSGDPGSVPDGVGPVRSPEASPPENVVVACAGDYDTLWPLLDRLPDVTDLVNLTSGTSEQAREAASRFRGGAARYHDGALMAHPEHGEDAGTASLYDLAMLNFAWATLLGYLQTATLLGTAGVSALTVTPLLAHWLSTTVVDVIEDYAGQIDAGEYPGDGEWLELDAPVMTNLVRVTEHSGLDAALPRLIESVTATGIAAGLGKRSFASLVEIIRAPRS